MLRPALLMIVAGLTACGARPATRGPSVGEHEVGEPGEGEKPGEHGCPTCSVVACLSDGDLKAVDQITVVVDLEAATEKVTYRSAMLEISPGGARGAEAVKLDPSDWTPGTEYVLHIDATQMPGLTEAGAWKNAAARLKVRWDEPSGVYAKAIDLRIQAVGSCKR